MTAKSPAYRMNCATTAQIAEHLTRCDADFVPILSSRVDIDAYASKIASNAVRFEAWIGPELVGMVAAYCNDRTRAIAYITSVSVLKELTGQGIASRLLRHCIDYAKLEEFERISLQVAAGHPGAIRLYEKCGFSPSGTAGLFLTMECNARL